VRLGAEVVHLVGPQLPQQVDQGDAVGEVGVVEYEGAAGLVRVLVDVVDPLGVERGGAAHHPVHGVALVQQQLGEVRAVLAGDAGDECRLARSVVHA
jgi:hypothetical protein